MNLPAILHYLLHLYRLSIHYCLIYSGLLATLSLLLNSHSFHKNYNLYTISHLHLPDLHLLLLSLHKLLKIYLHLCCVSVTISHTCSHFPNMLPLLLRSSLSSNSFPSISIGLLPILIYFLTALSLCSSMTATPVQNCQLN